MEFMSAEAICNWLKAHFSSLGKPIDEEISAAIIANDLDGEAMAAAVQQGPETLKEAVPLLGKRLKLIAALKFLKSQDEGTSSSQFSTPQLTPSRSASLQSRSLLMSHLVCKKKKATVDAEFELPFFCPETRKNLKAKICTERDRRHIVRDLSTMLLATNSHPSLEDCAVPAKELIKAYPFLGDADSDEPHYSWMKFISTRCSNVNRENDGNEVKSKRPKKEQTIGKHFYLCDID